MAKITEITYQRLCTHRVDRFENERVAATAVLEKGDSPSEVAQKLKLFVDQQLGLAPSQAEIELARQIVANAENGESFFVK